MTYARQSFATDLETLPRMPSWITSARPETPEEVAFLSGAALSHLHLVLRWDDVPQTLPKDLLRARLALRAAEACVTHQGRKERAGDLRDAVAFLQPGDSPGPAGEVYLTWRRAVERPVSVKSLRSALQEIEVDQIATWLDGSDPSGAAHAMGAGQGAPVPRAAAVLQSVMEDRPRHDTASLLLADAALAQALGWGHVLPLVALGLTRADLQKTGEELRLACHRAIVSGSASATQEASDLARRAERLRAVVPKLRAKGAEEAVTLLLRQEAVAPTALTSLRSDRAARRFCDRLVELGAVRELTGRDTFRLYGV